MKLGNLHLHIRCRWCEEKIMEFRELLPRRNQVIWFHEIIYKCTTLKEYSRTWSKVKKNKEEHVKLLICSHSPSRHTQVCSVWWWTPTRCCQSTLKRSLRCIRARNVTRCHHTSTPSQTMPTGTWCKVTVCVEMTDQHIIVPTWCQYVFNGKWI